MKNYFKKILKMMIENQGAPTHGNGKI